MTLTVGDNLPDATLIRMGDNGPEAVWMGDRLSGRKVVIFGLPGAYTPTCSSVHVPSFIKTADQFFKRGVDEIICVAVNDPHVMRHWGATTGGTAAGITFLADAGGGFTKAIGMNFDAPPVGFYGRSKRYAIYAEDSVVVVFNPEIARGVCEISSGEALLGQI